MLVYSRIRYDTPTIIMYRAANLLRERDTLTPNLELRLGVNLSCDLGQ